MALPNEILNPAHGWFETRPPFRREMNPHRPEEADFAEAEQVAVRGLLASKSLPPPELLAWSVLWLRAWSILEAARCAIAAPNTLPALLLWRPAFEVQFQLLAIYNFSIDSLFPGMTGIESTRSKLLAYLAWGLASDLEFAERRSDPNEIAGLNVPQGPDLAPYLDSLYGPSPIVSEQESEHNIRRERAAWTKRVGQIKSWLSDDRLQVWHLRITQLRGPDLKRPVPSYYEILGADNSRFTTALKALELPLAYPAYMRGSRVLHGSTIREYLMGHFDDSVVIGAVEPDDARWGTARELYQVCRNILAGLVGLAETLRPTT
jgi:hypothetical protein